MSNYFLISILLVFFMLLYVYASTTLAPREPFAASQAAALARPESVVVFQGSTLPDFPIAPTQPDALDPSSPAVDGTQKGPRSKFFFAYNDCRLDCCADSGGYSCSGGCPCMTPDQKKFAGSRGYNSRPAKCSYDEKDF